MGSEMCIRDRSETIPNHPSNKKQNMPENVACSPAETKSLKCLYNSFIESHLLYCASVWGTASQNLLKPLFSAQKKGVRALNSKSRFFYDSKSGTIPSHTKPIFTAHKLLALPNIITKSILCIIQKSRLKVAPVNIQSLFSPASSTSTPQYNTIVIESIRTLTSSDFSETSHMLTYANGGTNTAYFRSEKLLVR